TLGASALVKERFRMFTPPSCASLAIFPDEYPKPHACTAVAVLASFTKFHQSVAQFVVVSRRWGDGDRLTRSRAIFWRNDEPPSIGTLLITTVLVISVAARPRLGRIAPPIGSWATASCTGIASAMARKAEAPKARYILPSLLN